MKEPPRRGPISDEPLRSEGEQQAFFAAALERSLSAGGRAGTIVRDILIVGSRLRLVFAGNALAGEFMPALAHREVPSIAAADLTVHVWDSESTGVAMVDPPCRQECFTRRGDIWGLASERIRIAFHGVEGSVNLLDLDAAIGIYWVPTFRSLPEGPKASPFRSLLYWWLQRIGCQLLPGAVFGNETGGVFIAGMDASGRSAAALACLAAGMSVVGENYVAVGLDPAPRAHNVYGAATMNQALQIATSLPLRAVLVPCLAKGEAAAKEKSARLSAIAKQDVAGPAAFEALTQFPHAGRQTHGFVERLAGLLPVARIVLGGDIHRIPAAIAELLAMSDEALVALSAARAPTRHRPLVSVIVPVHDGARFLDEAMATILDQAYPALEIIVIDDGSSDAIDAAVADLPISVRYLKQAQAGASAARNRGIREARGEVIAFLDVDDLWPRGVLAALIDRLADRPDLALVRGYAQLVVGDGASGGLTYRGSPDESFADYIGAGIYRREAFARIGLFDETMRFSEDIDWFNRARERGLAIERIEQVTLLVRRHGENMTRGRTLLELNTLSTLKRALDRRRAPGSA
jgi:GT2 family glycosyltransferase